MPRYGLATIYEDHPVGHEFTVDNLPLHLTHVDSFEISLEADELAARLAHALARQEAIEVRALPDKFYGPDKDILVTPLELTPELTELHQEIVSLLLKEGATFKNPHFNGDSFTPHISVYGAKRVKVGDIVPIGDITLSSKVSDAEDANRRVLANFTLSS
jgi:2'-5' RNA ligase